MIFALRGLAIALAILFAVPHSVLASADRVALVMGLGGYENIPTLTNPRNDAEGLAGSLDSIGFDVTLALDPTAAEMRQLMADFAFQSETADLALIYFAGHGVEVQGENFLLPVDANPNSNRDVQRQSVSLRELLATVERARKMRIVILDSCRDNPLGDGIDHAQAQSAASSASDDTTRGGGGLAPADPDRGTLVAFAARDGQVALDGKQGNSPYARALMDKVTKPGLEISLMFRQVRDAVLEETNNLQEPHTYGSLSGTPFYLAGAPDGGSSQSWSEMRPDQEKQLMALAELGDTRSMLGLARIRLNPVDPRFDPTEAADFLEKAVQAGSPEAQMELALLYEQGLGVPVDEERALSLYQAAADQDFPDAINDLGFLYYQGKLGLERDVGKALELFERAADLRHPEALFNFAALIDDKHIEGKGPTDAAEYLYAALRSGSRDVLDLLLERPNMFTLDTRKELQVELQANNFYAGGIDGDFGPGTKAAVKTAFGL